VLAPINSVVPAVKLIPQSLPVHVRIVDFVKVPATLFEPACLIPRSNVRTSGVPVVKHTQSMIVVISVINRTRRVERHEIDDTCIGTIEFDIE
jgi:hypothetical protein